MSRVDAKYNQALAECGAPPSRDFLTARAANQFMESVPCGPDGQPLDGARQEPAQAGR